MSAPRRVLVIDPDPAIRALLVAILHREGYAADAAQDPEQALRLRRSVRHAAVIVEPRLLGGPALLEELADAAPGAAKNFIVVTSPDRGGSIYEGKAGVWKVLMKPFVIDDLTEALASCCDGDGM